MAGFFIEDLQVTGVDFHAAAASAVFTGKCLVMVTDDAESTISTFLGANLGLTSNELDEFALIKIGYTQKAMWSPMSIGLMWRSKPWILPKLTR